MAATTPLVDQANFEKQAVLRDSKGEYISPFHPANAARLFPINPYKSAHHKHMQLDVSYDMEPLEHDWRRLEAEPHISVHQTYDWCRLWLASSKGRACFIILRFNGSIEFILPLEIHSHLGIETAELIGTEHSNINVPLASSALIDHAQDDFCDWFFHHIKQLKLDIDVLSLTKMRLAFKNKRNLLAPIAKVENQNPSFQLPLKGDFEATLAQLNAKRRRKKFRQNDKKLKQFGGYRHEIAHSEAEITQFLAAFYTQKALRFKSQGLPNVFASAAIQKFMLELSLLGHKDMAHLEIHALRLMGSHNGAIIAVAALSVKDGHVICQFSAFDDDVALKTNTSPGELLFHLIIEDACEKHNDVFDFGIGDQSYKHSWCPCKTIHYDGFIPLSFKGRLYASFLSAVTSTKRYVKTSPFLFKVAAKIRSVRS